MDIIKKLEEYQDIKYGDFQCKLTPGIDRNNVIGVRVPDVRKIAKELSKYDLSEFYNNLPHKYYDEDMLHGLLISEIKDYNKCMQELDKFLPFVNNWAVCDIMSPKIFKKNKDKLILKIKEWIKAKDIYTCRFGIKMLMTHYLDDIFNTEYLDMVSSIKSDEYYINMMISWYFATSLAKQWDSSIKILECNVLDKWVHNKTIQKALESFRITKEQKEYLSTLKR